MIIKTPEELDEFRDSISTVDKDGKRVWVYPKKPKGRYHNWRILTTIVLLGLLFSGPFIKIDGQPLLLLNFFERKFIIFGSVFWPQDTHLLIFVLMIFVVFIILFTTVYGRVWCGWACPQTIFMEMVFRKIEYWIEGDANKQRKLSAAPWTTEKIFKKVVKQVIFLSISIIIAHTVMAYLIGVDGVIDVVSESPMENLSGFLGLVVFAGIFYGVFAVLREQACTVICPYGRLQGVLLDKNSIVVAYDWLRGEPRGKLRKNVVDEDKGDCIDCHLCVQVCPTGIDIRNGTQLECVNCTACIDACDDVMLKINKPKGLIRFDSYNGITEKKKLKFTPRMAGYSAILLVLIGALTYLLISREPLEATITRVPGMTFQEQPDGRMSNLYNIQIINKTFEAAEVKIAIGEGKGEIKVIGENDLVVPEQSRKESTFFIIIPKDELLVTSTKLTIQVFSQDELIDEIETRFLGPITKDRQINK